MTTKTTEPDKLTEDAVREIESSLLLAVDGKAMVHADYVAALIRDLRAMRAERNLAYTNAPHTEEAGEVCTDDCEGCRNPVAALIHDRNAARGLAYQRGRELDTLQSQLESAGSLNAALREQLAQSRSENERLASQLKQWQEEKDAKAGYL